MMQVACQGRRGHGYRRSRMVQVDAQLLLTGARTAGRRYRREQAARSPSSPTSGKTGAALAALPPQRSEEPVNVTLSHTGKSRVVRQARRSVSYVTADVPVLAL